MKIAVIGTGYVGLVSGTCFAEIGHDVICVDKNENTISQINQGSIPIYEPGLSELVATNVNAGRLSFTTNTHDAVTNADVVIIAVGTPSRANDGHADLSYVFSAAEEIAQSLNNFTVIVTKSTVPVGTGDLVEQKIRAARPNADFAVASNPEFLREGNAILDFMEPDRIVVGLNNDHGLEQMQELYTHFLQKSIPVLFVARRTSELTKYAANAFLSVKLTFINEMAELCESVGADVVDLSKGIGLDKRIGKDFLNAGPGYGGSCFPKDTLALVRTAHDFNTPLRTVETIVAINEYRKRSMARKIRDFCGGDVTGMTIAILGLTFKPDTDDMRESPSIAIIEALQDFGAQVRAYDPQGTQNAKSIFKDIVYTQSPYEAAENADAIVLITNWSEFSDLNFARLASIVKKPVFIDLRNQLKENMTQKHGFKYLGVGKG